MEVTLLIEREIQDASVVGGVRRLEYGKTYDLPLTIALGLINAGCATLEPIKNNSTTVPPAPQPEIDKKIEEAQAGVDEAKTALVRAEKKDKAAAKKILDERLSALDELVKLKDAEDVNG